MTAIRLIAVPYELGRLRDGVGLGPGSLLEHGAVDALGAHGAAVETTMIEVDEPADNEVDTSFAVIRRVADAVRAARSSGEFPVILSGSCFSAVGVVAGLGETTPGVVWFDAHADFNEPGTAVYGYLDGMGLAILVGDAWQGLAAQVPGARPLPETAIVLAGARAIDDPERVRLEASSIKQLPVTSLGPAALVEAIDSIEPAPSGLYLHVDLDVLDSDVARVNRYAAPGGLSAEELEASLRALLGDRRVRAVSLTAYEPEADPDARVPPIAARLLTAVAECAREAESDGTKPSPAAVEAAAMSALRERDAFKDLERHRAEIGDAHLRDLFAADPDRGERLVAEAAGLYLDFSKNRLTDETLRLLAALADECGLAERREAMFRGEHINSPRAAPCSTWRCGCRASAR